jgi:hypothetical protein
MPTQFDEKGKMFTDVITKKPVRVMIQTSSHLIQGDIHIKPDERIKDALQFGDHYVAVTNACVYNGEGKELYRCNFIALNQSHIVWLMPTDDLIEPGQPA